MKFSVYFILNESQFNAKYSVIEWKCNGTKIKIRILNFKIKMEIKIGFSVVLSKLQIIRQCSYLWNSFEMQI